MKKKENILDGNFRKRQKIGKFLKILKIGFSKFSVFSCYILFRETLTFVNK